MFKFNYDSIFFTHIIYIFIILQIAHIYSEKKLTIGQLMTIEEFTEYTSLMINVPITFSFIYLIIIILLYAYNEYNKICMTNKKLKLRLSRYDKNDIVIDDIKNLYISSPGLDVNILDIFPGLNPNMFREFNELTGDPILIACGDPTDENCKFVILAGPHTTKSRVLAWKRSKLLNMPLFSKDFIKITANNDGNTYLINYLWDECL